MRSFINACVITSLFSLTALTSAAPAGTAAVNPIADLEARGALVQWYQCPAGTPQGTTVCVSETTFTVCMNYAQGSIVLPVAPHTICQNGKLVPTK